MTNAYEEERRLIKEYEVARHASVDSPPKKRANAADQRLEEARTELHRFWQPHSATEEAGR